MEDVVAVLRAAVGRGQVVTDRAVCASYEVDWTGRFVGRAAAVVRPRSVEEVAATLAACSAHGIAVVPQGGNTGLVGGSVPLAGEVVLSLRALDTIDDVDVVARQVTVGAGVVLETMQAVVRSRGLELAVDIGARGSATIGGMAATNAGGNRMLRHGGMRQQVVGIEAVLADGRVVRHLSGLRKDNTGYDLPGLLVGSEGTLAAITAVRVALVPVPRQRVSALLGCADVAAAVDVVVRLRDCVAELETAELFFDHGVRLVMAELGVPPPFPTHHAAYVLVEAAGPDPLPELAGAVERLGSLVQATAVAVDGDRARLWAVRDRHTEAINRRGIPHKLDVTLPLSALARFTSSVAGAVREVAPAAEVVLFGHAGDGNLHVNVLGAGPADPTVDDAVLRLVASYGGSISAEHGIGTAKAPWLHLNRSPEEIDVFRAIKRALDPAGILNPGVLVPGW